MYTGTTIPVDSHSSKYGHARGTIQIITSGTCTGIIDNVLMIVLVAILGVDLLLLARTPSYPRLELDYIYQN